MIQNDILTLATQSLTKPEDFGYWGDRDMFNTWGFAGIDKSRDASISEKSNFEVITKDLISKYPDDFEIENFGHWAVGSIDRLICRVLKESGNVIESSITEAFLEVIEWHKRLEEDPIADENHYSSLEFDECIDSLENMSDYLLNMIDTDNNEDWAIDIHFELVVNMNVSFYPDHGDYPKDDDIKMAIYNLQIWNLEAIDEWNKWIDQNGLERLPLRKENPNQLKLFEESNE